ncbi:hypothetical protein DOY81_002430 [Sarcophaga bullata]|nr:hypothetical protein DOY81_002430 [Sarcophaga bullata]
MLETNGDGKFPDDNVGSTHYKNTSMSSLSISTVTSKTATLTNQSAEANNGKRMESLTDEEIIQKNIRELMDKKNREERKANGRLVAVVLATLVIFLGAYHAWMKTGGKLAGVLVPAFIMLSFGIWVVVLAKRDKARRQMFEKYLQEVALKNKQELENKSKSKAKKSHERRTSTETLLHHENEIKNKEKLPLKTTAAANAGTTAVKPSSLIVKSNDHRKHRKHRNAANNSDGYSTTSSSSSKKSSHYATKDLRVKRPSIRQKLFRQTGIYNMPSSSSAKAHVNATQTLVQAIINTPGPQCSAPLINKTPATLAETKRKRLQRLNALQVPTMVRMGSAP